MADGIEDRRGHLGREQNDGGDPRKQDTTRADSDRGYGAREGQRESGRDDTPDRGQRSGQDFDRSTPDSDRGDEVSAARDKGEADSDGRGVYGKPGQFYEHQKFGMAERSGAYAPGTEETDPRFSGADGGRTDRFGGRGDQQHDDKAGWRAVGDANPDGRIGGEDEKPGDGDPLGAGVR